MCSDWRRSVAPETAEMPDHQASGGADPRAAKALTEARGLSRRTTDTRAEPVVLPTYLTHAAGVVGRSGRDLRQSKQPLHSAQRLLPSRAIVWNIASRSYS